MTPHSETNDAPHDPLAAFAEQFALLLDAVAIKAAATAQDEALRLIVSDPELAAQFASCCDALHGVTGRDLAIVELGPAYSDGGNTLSVCDPHDREPWTVFNVMLTRHGAAGSSET